MIEVSPNKDTFKELFAIDVNGHKETKNGLGYLSWPWAWAEIKKRYPDAAYNVERHPETGLPYWYDEKTGFIVFTTVTIEGMTYGMHLPVMDGANKAMKDKPYNYTVMQYDKSQGRKVPVTKTCEAASMFDVNKTIMRCLVKNLAMFGLGLYIYAGEDLPEDPPLICETCGKEIIKANVKMNDGAAKMLTPEEVAAFSRQYSGKTLCMDCLKAAKSKQKAEKEAAAKQENQEDQHE